MKRYEKNWNGQDRRHSKKKSTKMVWTHASYGHQSAAKTSSALDSKRREEKTRQTPKKLEFNNSGRPEDHCNVIGRGRNISWRQNDMEKLCCPMCCRHEDGLRSKVRDVLERETEHELKISNAEAGILLRP